MAKKKRTYNLNLIRTRWSYYLREIAELFGIHIRTVQEWRRKGMKVVDESSRPHMVSGRELKRFLVERRKNRRCKMQDNEFLCHHCRCPRESCTIPSVEYTGKKLGRYQQVAIKGLCEVCLQPLIRFSSDRQVKEFRGKGMVFEEQETVLIGNANSCINTDIEEEKKDEDQCKE